MLSRAIWGLLWSILIQNWKEKKTLSITINGGGGGGPVAPPLDPPLLKDRITTLLYNTNKKNNMLFRTLKGKFSTGREGALASKFNYDFKEKQLSEVMPAFIFESLFE